MNRRQFIQAASASLLLSSELATLVTPHVANASTFWEQDRILWLHRQDERGKIIDEFRVVYWSQGQVDPANYVRCCYMLRDARESSTVMMDVNLLNLLYGIQQWNDDATGKVSPIIIHSGYRTPEHNAELVKKENAAPNSMHLYGRAADIHIKGISPSRVGEMAKFFKMGGVGYYDTFTHVDTGRVRFWKG